LRDRTSFKGWIGIALALLAIPLLSYQPADNGFGEGSLWIVLSLLVFLAWGIQAYVMRFANQTMKAESIYFYMMITGILLVPAALLMTDFSQPINWGFKGPYLTFLIQTLNAVGALTIVYAFRYGKAMVVSPLTNAVAPVITIVLSLILYQVIPHWIIIAGMLLAIISIFLLAVEDSEPACQTYYTRINLHQNKIHYEKHYLLHNRNFQSFGMQPKGRATSHRQHGGSSF
jgi:drug/metabolite transporter (DMT)-like permease